MGRRTRILNSIVADLKTLNVFAEVRRIAALPATIPSLQFPYAAVWQQSEEWDEVQFPSRVLVEASIIVDIYDRTGARSDGFDSMDSLLERVAGALYTNSARNYGGYVNATMTRVDRVDFGETDDPSLVIMRLVLKIRSHRAPGVET
jgi:hypothetical protein